jgi:hypothetical protein
MSREFYQYRAGARRSALGLLLKIVGALAVVVLSFSITLYILKSWSRSSADQVAARLASLNVSELSALEPAAANAGLAKSDTIRGWMGHISREADGRLQVSGWATDGAGDGRPIAVFALLNGKVLLRMDAKGSLDEIRAHLPRLGFPRPEVAQEVLVEGVSEESIACRDVNRLIAVAINAQGQFHSLRGNPPQGCQALR